MHRQFSLQPFSRHYSHSTNPFLDLLNVDASGSISVGPDQRSDLAEVLGAYQQARDSGLLHTITFVTVNDYLWLLRSVSKELAELRSRAMYYLAAAVSDFFLPRQRLVSCSSPVLTSYKLIHNGSRNTKYSLGRAAY